MTALDPLKCSLKKSSEEVQAHAVQAIFVAFHQIRCLSASESPPFRHSSFHNFHSIHKHEFIEIKHNPARIRQTMFPGVAPYRFEFRGCRLTPQSLPKCVIDLLRAIAIVRFQVGGKMLAHG